MVNLEDAAAILSTDRLGTYYETNDYCRQSYAQVWCRPAYPAGSGATRSCGLRDGDRADRGILGLEQFAQPDSALRSRRHELDELMRQFVEEPSLAADLGCRFASLTAGGIGLLGGQSSQFPTGRNKLHL